MQKYFNKTSINIQGISVGVTSNNPEYISFLKAHFGIKLEQIQDCNIQVYLQWKEDIWKNTKPYYFDNLDKMTQVGRRIWIGNNEIIWNELGEVKDLKLRFAYGDKRQINAYYNLSLSRFFVKRFYKQIIRGTLFQRYKKDIYNSITYYLVYYPILYELERKGIFPLHGSSINFKNKGVLIPGLPGVGKSTLCLALLSYKNSKFISDNIALYDEKKVYSCFEPIKLDRRSIDLLPDKGQKLVDMGINSYYGRSSYKISERETLHETIPDILLIPWRAERNELIRIHSNQAAQLILDFNKIAGEINSYFIYSSVQNMCLKKESVELSRLETLHNLTNKLKCYILLIKSNSSLDLIIEQIEKRIINDL